MPDTRTNFRLLWLAQAVSALGDNFSRVVIPFVLIKELNASKTGLAVVASMQWLPFAVRALPIGSFVQRADWKSVMVAADAARFTLFVLLAILLDSGALDIWLMGALIFAVGSFTVAYEVSSDTIVPSVVPREDLGRANALLQSTETMARLIGPPAAGFVMVLSVKAGFLVDAASYLVAGVCTYQVHVRQGSIASADARSRIRWADGLRAIARLRDLRVIVGVTAVSNVFATAMYVTSLFFLVNAKNVGEIRFGLLLSCGAIGGVLGGLGMARLRTMPKHRSRLTALGLFLDGPPLALAIFALGSQSFPVLGIAMGLGGLGLSVYNVSSQTLRQEIALDQTNPAQIHASSKLITWGAVPVGMALGAYLLETQSSVGLACFLPGLLAVALASVVWFVRFGQGADMAAGRASELS